MAFAAATALHAEATTGVVISMLPSTSAPIWCMLCRMVCGMRDFGPITHHQCLHMLPAQELRNGIATKSLLMVAAMEGKFQGDATSEVDDNPGFSTNCLHWQSSRPAHSHGRSEIAGAHQNSSRA